MATCPRDIQKVARSHDNTRPAVGQVLVVDDEDLVRELATTILSGAGFLVISAWDGNEAVARFKENSGTLTAVLLDLTMPHKDGREALSLMKKIRSDVPIVLTSGYNERTIAESLDNVKFIKKPYSASELVSLFRDLLSQ